MINDVFNPQTVAKHLNAMRPALEQALAAAQRSGDAMALTAAERTLRANTVQRFNNLLDAVVAGTSQWNGVAIISRVGIEDPEVGFPEEGSNEEDAFELLRSVVEDLTKGGGPPPLSGLKDHLRKRNPGFSEKDYGYGGFLQFVKAARAKGVVDMDWDDEAEDYFVSAGNAG